MTKGWFSAESRANALPVPAAMVIVSIFLGFGWQFASAAPRVASPAKFINIALSFEPNQGQANSAVQFVAHGSGYALWLESGQVKLSLEEKGETLQMSLIGANAKATAVGLDRQSGVVSYFTGNNPQNWHMGIATFGKVKYSQIYPGIDLVFYGNQRRLEYDFVVGPGADASRIAWRIDSADPRIDSEGDLVVGSAAFKKPLLYQIDGNQKIRVDGGFAVKGHRVRFRIGQYDHSRTLVVDPVLSYASYLGGSRTDNIGLATGPGNLQVGASQGLALDSAGSVYVTGYTYSVDFPTQKAYQSAPPIKQQGVPPGQWPSVFVSKFSPDGSSLLYSTYLGGNGVDRAYAIAVDGGGNAYVTGQTSSVDFPVTAGAYQTVCSPVPNMTGAASAAASCNSSNTSAFVTKLNSTGTGIVYSTFLGGYGWAYGTAIAVDNAGRAYIAGNEQQYCSTAYTFQSCFPTTGSAVIGGNQTGGASPQYAFAAAFDPTGAQLLYSTLFGDLNGFTQGAGPTWATGIAVDPNGYFYLIGDTSAGKLPTTVSVIQPEGIPLDSKGIYVLAWRGFVAKFNAVTSAGGVSLAYATYLGGHTASTGDYTSGITIDSSGNAYVAGYTNSKDFPVTGGAYGTVCGPNGQTCAAAHVTKLNPLGSSILWSTYVGGSKPDASDSLFFTGPIQLDGQGNIYIISQAGSGFPLVNPVEPAANGGSLELLLAELDPSGANLLFSTRLGSGGKNTANPAGLAVDAAGNVYVAGNSNGPDLITTAGAFQVSSSDGACCQYGNGFVAKIAPAAAPVLESGTLANGATYIAGGLVPGSWAQVKGTNLSTATRIWTASDFTGLGNNLPTNLSGVSVKVNDQTAAVYYVSSTQVSFQVPSGVTGDATVRVIAGGTTSNPVTAQAANSSPGIFPIILGGTNYAAAVFLDGKIAADPSYGAAFRNALPGDIVQLFATGLAPSPAGTLVSTTLLGGVTVTIGTVNIPASAAALVAVGEFQVNFTVPQSFASAAAALYPISISVNGVASPATINSSPPGPVVIPIQPF
jgi:uncharacterized protein (TIGR03437 family)